MQSTLTLTERGGWCDIDRIETQIILIAFEFQLVKFYVGRWKQFAYHVA